MTPHRQQLTQQLAIAPDDIELKKVYADALIEEGGEHAIRGELIHLELAKLDTARRQELAASLRRAREARGLGQLDGYESDGFAWQWDCSADQLARFGASVFSEEPLLRWIYIQIKERDVKLEMRTLAATPMLARVRCLSIIGNPSARPGPRGIATLLESPHWPRLENLQLANCRIWDAGAELLAKSMSLTNLRWLDLWANGVRSSGVTALARSPFLGRVQHLGLWGCQPGAKGLTALAAAENRMKLDQLDIDEMQMFAGPLAAIRKRFPGIEIRNQVPDPEPEPFERGPFV